MATMELPGPLPGGPARGHVVRRASGAAAEDAVATGPDGAGGDEQDDGPQELSLEQLYDTGDCQDDGDEPNDHVSSPAHPDDGHPAASGLPSRGRRHTRRAPAQPQRS